MDSLFHFVSPPAPCGYLAKETAQMEYEHVPTMNRAEYLARLNQGWRHFGAMAFRPQCPTCRQCRSLRVLVNRFLPTRSQKRNRRLNEGLVRLQVGKPSISSAKLALYDRFHAFQTEVKNWPAHPDRDVDSYAASFVVNPFPIEEWCYSLDGRLIGVGYVDYLAEGLSAIYFFYDPKERRRGLGTWNVLNLIDQARMQEIPYVYLGYYVAGCPSLAYKARFRPHERLEDDGVWREPANESRLVP